jgi:predicted ATPase/DNA-binding SARP family transcriptional activator
MDTISRPKLSLRFFGAPYLERDGQRVEPDTRKAIALLAYLVVTGQPHTRDALAALLYPENDESHAKAALRRTLSALNKTLGEGNLSTAHDAVAIDANPSLWVDVNEFTNLLNQAQSCRHDAAEACPICLPWLEQAACLYRGDFLAGFSLRDCPGFDEWQYFKSEELRRQYATALGKLARSASQNADHEKAIAHARQWVALDPLMEDAQRELMVCYVQAGQRNAALRQYQTFAHLLEKELGVAPLEETQNLYHLIQQNQLGRTSQGIDMAAPGSPLSPAVGADTLLGVRFPLVGRSLETDSLLRAYRQGAPRGHFFALQGEAGIGKSRLAEEFAAWARQNGATVLSARCFEGETSLAYAPFIEALSTASGEQGMLTRLSGLPEDWLDEAARLLPTLRPGAKSVTDQSPSAQSKFFEGLRQVFLRLLSSQSPGVLFLDDLHWTDPASLDFLAYLVRRLPGNPLFILAAWREEGLPTQARLRQILAEAQRAGFATNLTLNRLQPTAIADLARLVVGRHQDLPAGFTDRLFRESEGLPYFLVEYLDALLVTQASAHPSEKSTFTIRDDWELPDRVRDLLRLRVAQVDELSRQLLAAAAVIGRSFDFATLVASSGRSEVEALNGLETLLAHRLIEECGECEPAESLTYDFTHDKLRSLVYEETSLTRRRLLHQRVAEALAERARRSRQPGLTAGVIAYHYHLAGQDQQAADYYRRAGEHAHQLYANRQALEHYRAALQAGHPDQAGLQEAIGDLHTLLGEYQPALECYTQAVAIAVGARDNARLVQKIGAVYQRLGDPIQAAGYYQKALRILDTSATLDSFSASLGARILADWSLAAYQQGEMENALNLAQQALERADDANAPRALAQAHNLLGVLARRRGQNATARRHLEESLALGVRLHDESAQAAALNNLALLLSEESQSSQAIDYAQKALALCERLGDRHRAAALHNNLADLYHKSGQPDQAIDHLKQAVIIFTEIGGGAGDMQPEVWKLTEW